LCPLVYRFIGIGKINLGECRQFDLDLFQRGCQSYVLDGDNIRHGLNKDLGFSPDDRKENIRRIGEVAKLFVDSGLIVLTAFISPFREDRRFVRRMFAQDKFIEIYVKCPLNICEQRDPKGLYRMARTGKITNFTGIDSPYEKPDHPEITIDTTKLDVESSVERLIDYLKEKKIIG